MKKVTFTCPKCHKSKSAVISDEALIHFTMAVIAGIAKRKCECGKVTPITSVEDFTVEEVKQ